MSDPLIVAPPARSVDEANAEFWNELCGSSLAQQIGVRDHSPESLARFDAAFLDMYPYLLGHVRPAELKGRRVLEVGLGFGTLGQKLAEAGADYLGLDIADGPVAMMNHRLRSNGLAGRAVQGSMLDCPVEPESMDAVVSIGCFHHTGNVQRCLDETWRVLRPGGRAVVMVYNRFSYQQWGLWPLVTFRALLGEFRNAPPHTVSEDQRRTYDADRRGRAAPETVLVSQRQLRRMLRRFSGVRIRKENASSELLIKLPLPTGIRLAFGVIMPRTLSLRLLGPRLGLDLYVDARKP